MLMVNSLREAPKPIDDTASRPTHNASGRPRTETANTPPHPLQPAPPQRPSDRDHFGNGKPIAPRTAFSFFESRSRKNVTFFLSDIF